jgi:truncated hemoglobin YjbI
MQALGHASVCWTPPEGPPLGQFDSEAAIKIGDELLQAWLQDRADALRHAAEMAAEHDEWIAQKIRAEADRLKKGGEDDARASH